MYNQLRGSKLSCRKGSIFSCHFQKTRKNRSPWVLKRHKIWIGLGRQHPCYALRGTGSAAFSLRQILPWFLSHRCDLQAHLLKPRLFPLSAHTDFDQKTGQFHIHEFGNVSVQVLLKSARIISKRFSGCLRISLINSKAASEVISIFMDATPFYRQDRGKI